MYGPLIVAAAILLSVAGIVLFLHDLSDARARKAFDRIFEEGAGGAASAPRVHRGRSHRRGRPQDADPGRGAAAKRATDAAGRPTAL